uniref:PB1 domain-containing protein n=1 Tax=Leersia perrieri TaxID=77586 RepID=A0A0D9W366_9ORYZ
MASSGEYGSSVSMMVSYGGKIVHGDNSAAAPCYAGGVHRIVKVAQSEKLSDLRARMAALAGFSSSDAIIIRYALPGDGLAHLRDVADDADLWGLVSLLLYHEASNLRRIRVFLFADVAPRRIQRSSSSPALATLGGACDGESVSGGIAVRVKVSFGGDFIKRDGSTASYYYAGGVHQIVNVGLSERLADLCPRLAALAGCSDVSIQYALPAAEEGHLGELRDVASDGDLWTLVSLLFFHEAFTDSRPKQGRIRVFLFGEEIADSPATPLLRRSASLPSLATSSFSDGDMEISGGKNRHGKLATVVEEEDEDEQDTAAAASTSSASDDTAATAAAMSGVVGVHQQQLVPVAWVPVIPVCPVQVVFIVA